MGLDRGFPGQARVRTLGVVIGDPPAKVSPQLRAGLAGLEINTLVLQGSPEAFDEDVVHPKASAVHADADLGLAQHRGAGLRREVDALVGFEDLRCTEPSQRILQFRGAEAGVHGVRQPLGQHLAGRPVHDRGQIEEAAVHGDAVRGCRTSVRGERWTPTLAAHTAPERR